jgi:hypothetical protein
MNDKFARDIQDVLDMMGTADESVVTIHVNPALNDELEAIGRGEHAVVKQKNKALIKWLNKKPYSPPSKPTDPHCLYVYSYDGYDSGYRLDLDKIEHVWASPTGSRYMLFPIDRKDGWGVMCIDNENDGRRVAYNNLSPRESEMFKGGRHDFFEIPVEQFLEHVRGGRIFQG